MTATNAPPSPASARPLSPHLSVYRFTVTMTMSILHRITGCGLYLGALLLAWFLIATSMDAAAFGVVSSFLSSIIGRFILFGFSWSLFHHAVGGVRHIIWDAGYGLETPEREWLAWGTLIGGFALTIIVWSIGYAVR
ncbi:MAG TPA: succinate dehydrogenase, cytochrome b556 subunit [Roseiarcus sp.]|nr:succinate dehydrogenase, cytochrome b556 subunit [Roseiarcus sp.]